MRPGEVLDVDLLLTSRAETPVDFIDLTLRGVETSARQTGNDITWLCHQHVGLHTRFQATMLTRGQHRFRARFDVPAGAPVTYSGVAANIRYELEVHVSIPWWRDVQERYVIHVAPTPVPVPPRAARIFASAPEGPVAQKLYLEASLDGTWLEPGGVLSGAVSLSNVRRARVRGVDVHFVALERDLDESRSATEARRYTLRICDGEPREAEPAKFRACLPREAPAGWRGALSELVWFLDIMADVAWGDDVGLRIPILVVPPSGNSWRDSPVHAVVPVGRERRAQVWAAAGARLGLIYDPETEHLSTKHGSVALSICLEERGAHGLYMVATLAWPGLGLDIEIADRRWSDFFTSVETGDAAFERQFRVRAREPAQARALLDASVRAALLGFPEARVDDQGATLAAPGTGQAPRPFEDFVRKAIATAMAFDAAIARVPPPAEMASHAEAWRAFAGRLGGRFEPGRIWIHGGTYGMERVDIGTVWNRRGALESTVISMTLEGPAGSHAAGFDPASLPERAQALYQEIAREALRVEIEENALRVGLPAPLTNPSALEPLLDRMARLCRALRGESERGPFR